MNRSSDFHGLFGELIFPITLGILIIPIQIPIGAGIKSLASFGIQRAYFIKLTAQVRIRAAFYFVQGPFTLELNLCRSGAHRQPEVQ